MTFSFELKIFAKCMFYIPRYVFIRSNTTLLSKLEVDRQFKPEGLILSSNICRVFGFILISRANCPWKIVFSPFYHLPCLLHKAMVFVGKVDIKFVKRDKKMSSFIATPFVGIHTRIYFLIVSIHNHIIWIPVLYFWLLCLSNLRGLNAFYVDIISYILSFLIDSWFQKLAYWTLKILKIEC